MRDPLKSFLQPAAAQLGLGFFNGVLVEFILAAVVIGATIGITLVFRRLVDRRPWQGMAMSLAWRRWRDAAAGLGLGAGMILVVFGVEYGLGWIRIISVKEGFTVTAVVAIITARFLHFLATGVCEEVVYRSYLFQNVAERFPIWIAVLATGGVFALSHFPASGFSWGFVVSGIIASFFLAFMRLLTQAIWFGVAWHVGWDWVEDGVGLIPGYSALDTQRVGPPLWVGRGLAIEGGLLIILVLAAGLSLLLGWCRFTGKAVDLGAKLNDDGTIQDPVAVAADSNRWDFRPEAG
jgi:membrane protease YdiL (CAAX protease family)